MITCLEVCGRSAQRLVSSLRKNFFLWCAVSIAVAISQGTVYAEVNTWQNGGDLQWSTSGNWSTGAIPGSADTAYFPISGVNSGVVNLGGETRTVSSLISSNAAYSFTNGTLSASSFSFYGGTVSAILAGSGSLTKCTTNTLKLTATNTCSGGTVINGGTLTLNRKTGCLAADGNLTVGGNGTFNMDNVGASGSLTQQLGVLTFTNGHGTVVLTTS